MSECHHLDRCGLSSAPTRGIRICDGAELATYLAPLRRCARACYELVRGGRLRVRFFRFFKTLRPRSRCRHGRHFDWTTIVTVTTRNNKDSGELFAWATLSGCLCCSSMEDALVATSCRGDLLIVTRNNSLGYSHHAFQKLYPVCIPHKRLEHTSLCIVRFNHKADAVILAGRHFLGVASDQRTHNNVFLCEFLGVASTTRPKWRAVPFR